MRFGSLIRRPLQSYKVAVWLTLLFFPASCSDPSVDLTSKNASIELPAANVLRFAGDVMLARGVGRRITEANDPAFPFRRIASFLAEADIAFVNLESPFSEKRRRTPAELVFNADPANIAGLQLAGIDVASTANNHSRDAGPRGVEFTYKWLRLHGIQPVGSGASSGETHRGVVLERHGVRFGFLAYTYDQQNGNWHDIDDRIAVIDAEAMKRDVSALSHRCNTVIVSMHNGIEYHEQPNRSQISFAHASIDAGAKLVVGHHPHVVQRFESYRGGLIFYSLGNFVFDQFQRQATQRGEIAEVRMLGDFIESAQVFPVQITRDGPVLLSEKETAPGKLQKPPINPTVTKTLLNGKHPFAQDSDTQKAAAEQ